jgi:alpha-galactosidase/6-phospho-beta-glucosidase family protein
MIEAPVKRKLFLQKGEYQTCHMFLEETQERLAAIIVGQNHYTFFKTVRDRNKALDILAKLYDNGSDAVIVQAPKAYAIWVLEPESVG